MKKPKYKASGHGFSLIEILVVISIIGLLSSVILVVTTKARITARDARRKADMRQFTIAINLYFDKYLVYPPAQDDTPPHALDLSTLPATPTFIPALVTEELISKPLTDPKSGSSYWYQTRIPGDFANDANFSIACGNGGPSGQSAKAYLLFTLEGGVSNDFTKFGGSSNTICFY